MNPDSRRVRAEEEARDRRLCAEQVNDYRGLGAIVPRALIAEVDRCRSSMGLPTLEDAMKAALAKCSRRGPNPQPSEDSTETGDDS